MAELDYDNLIGVVARRESEFHRLADGITDRSPIWIRPMAPVLGLRLHGVVVGDDIFPDGLTIAQIDNLSNWWYESMGCRMCPGFELPPNPWHLIG